MVPLSKYNVLKIKVIFGYFKQEYVHIKHIHVDSICPPEREKNMLE